MTRPISPRCTQLLSEQKAASDLVIAGMQTSIDALATDLAATKSALATATQTITDRDATIATQRTQIGDLEIQHAADLATIEEDDETIAALQARVKELEDQLDPPPPPGKTAFGWFCGPSKFPNSNPTETKADMRTRVAAVMGCPPPVERIFNEGTFAVPAAGVPAVISFSLNVDQVLAGDYDAQLVWFTQELNVDTPYTLVLNHECDNPDKHIDPAKQRAAFTHFSQTVRSVGKANVTLAPIIMAWTIFHSDWEAWLPDPAAYDYLGVDSYWRPGGPNTTAGAFQPCLDAAAKVGKRLIIGETSLGAVGHGGKMQDGSPIPDATWTTFVSEMCDMLDRFEVVYVCWFMTTKTDGRWTLEDHPDALALYKEAAQASLT